MNEQNYKILKFATTNKNLELLKFALQKEQPNNEQLSECLSLAIDNQEIMNELSKYIYQDNVIDFNKIIDIARDTFKGSNTIDLGNKTISIVKHVSLPPSWDILKDSLKNIKRILIRTIEPTIVLTFYGSGVPHRYAYEIENNELKLINELTDETDIMEYYFKYDTLSKEANEYTLGNVRIKNDLCYSQKLKSHSLLWAFVGSKNKLIKIEFVYDVYEKGIIQGGNIKIDEREYNFILKNNNIILTEEINTPVYLKYLPVGFSEFFKMASQNICLDKLSQKEATNILKQYCRKNNLKSIKDGLISYDANMLKLFGIGLGAAIKSYSKDEKEVYRILGSFFED